MQRSRTGVVVVLSALFLCGCGGDDGCAECHTQPPPLPPDPPPPVVDRLPESGAKLAFSTAAPGRIYALASQLYRSDDGGQGPDRH